MLDQQRNPTDQRGIGFESNQKYHEVESSKEKEIEYLRKQVLKVSTKLNLIKESLK